VDHQRVHCAAMTDAIRVPFSVVSRSDHLSSFPVVCTWTKAAIDFVDQNRIGVPQLSRYELVEKGEQTRAQVAKMSNVSRATVSQILRRRAWRFAT